MKKIIKFLMIFLFGLIQLQISAKAQILNSKNYEECLIEIIKTSKNSEYKVTQEVCREKFPKLKKLSEKKDVKLSCADSNGKSIYNISVSNGQVSILEIGKLAFLTTSNTRERLTFKAQSEVNNNRSVSIFGNLNPITAQGSLTVEYQDKKSNDFIYNFTCIEE